MNNVQAAKQLIESGDRSQVQAKIQTMVSGIHTYTQVHTCIHRYKHGRELSLVFPSTPSIPTNKFHSKETPTFKNIKNHKLVQ